MISLCCKRVVAIIIVFFVIISVSSPADAFNWSGKGRNLDRKAISAMLALNYCHMSLVKILAYEDRIILDEEYNNIINNIRLSAIEDKEILTILQQLMDTLTTFKLAEQDKDFLVQEYNRKISNAFYSAFGTLQPYGSDLTEFFKPHSLFVNAAVNMGSVYANYQNNIESYRQHLDKSIWQLEKNTIVTINDLRKTFLQVSWELMRRYNIPEQWRLTERQLLHAINVFKEKDERRRYRELMHLQDNFEIFPPFWYMLARTAHEVGQLQQAHEIYVNIQNNYFAFFREDHDYSSALMSKVLLVQDIQKNQPNIFGVFRSRPNIEEDLKLIVQNSSDDWRKTLFAALQYIQLGLYDPAKVLLIRNIDLDRERSLHSRVLGDIYALARDEKQLTKLIEQMYQDDRVRYIDTLYLIGKIRDRHLMYHVIKTVFTPVIEIIDFEIDSRLLGRDILVVSIPDIWVRHDPANFEIKLQVLGLNKVYEAEKGFAFDESTRQVHFSFKDVINQKDYIARRNKQQILIGLSNLNQACLISVQVSVEDLPTEASLLQRSRQASGQLVSQAAQWIRRSEAEPGEERILTEPVIKFKINQMAVEDRCYSLDDGKQEQIDCDKSVFVRLKNQIRLFNEGL